MELETALCGEEGFLFARGYWDEQIRLAAWAFQAARALEDWPRAVRPAKDAIQIHLRREDDGALKRWNNRLAEALFHLTSQPRATVIGEVMDRTTLSVAAVTRVLGEIAYEARNYAEAERCGTDALKGSTTSGDKLEQVRCCNNLGRVARATGKFVKAEESYRDALALAVAICNKGVQARLLNDMGDLAMGRPPDDEISKAFFEAFKKAETGWGKLALTIVWIAALAMKGARVQDGERQLRPGALAEARKCYTQALEIGEELRISSVVADAQRGLADVLDQEKKKAEALIYADEAARLYRRLKQQRKYLETDEMARRIRIAVQDKAVTPAVGGSRQEEGV